MKDLNAIKNKLNDKDYLNHAVNAIADTFCNKCSNIRDLHIPQLTDKEWSLLHRGNRSLRQKIIKSEEMEIIRFAEENKKMSVMQIANHFNRSYSAIYKLIKSHIPHRIKRNKGKIPSRDFVLAHPEMSVNEIVAIIGCNIRTVYAIRRQVKKGEL